MQIDCIPSWVSLGNGRVVIRCLSKELFNDLHKANKSSQVADFQVCDMHVCSEQVCVPADYEWSIKSHAFVCKWLCVARGCRMIHLAVLLPAAVSSNLIRREAECISFSSSPRVVYESTNCLFDCLNKWHKANESELSAPCQMVWLSALCTSINHSHSSHVVCSLLLLFNTVTRAFSFTCEETQTAGLLWSFMFLSLLPQR